LQGRLSGREAEDLAGGGPKPCTDANSDSAGGGSQFWNYGQRRSSEGGVWAAGPTSEARVTPEPFPVDRSGWKEATDTKPEQLKIDLPESSQPFVGSHPGGDDLNSRYALKLVPRSGAGPAAGCTRAPPPHITPARLAVLVKMATEKNCYLEWQDTHTSSSTPLSASSTPRIATGSTSALLSEDLMPLRRCGHTYLCMSVDSINFVSYVSLLINV
jgi:hypothetical protein